VLRRDRAATRRAANAKILSKPETDSTSCSDSSAADSVTEGVFGDLAFDGESGVDLGVCSSPEETSPPAPSSEATAAFAAPAFKGTLAGAIGEDTGFKGAEAGFKGAEAGLSGAEAGLSGVDFGPAAEPAAGAATIGIVAGDTVAEVLGLPAAGPALSGTVCKPELAPAPAG
jgi:hypothetical protein